MHRLIWARVPIAKHIGRRISSSFASDGEDCLEIGSTGACGGFNYNYVSPRYHIHAMKFEKSFLSFHRYFSLQDSKIKFKVKSFFGRDIMQKGLIFTHYIRRATHFSKN